MVEGSGLKASIGCPPRRYLFCHVDYHAVRPEGRDEVPPPESERGEKRALEELAANASRERRPESGQGIVVGALLLLIRLEGYA